MRKIVLSILLSLCVLSLPAYGTASEKPVPSNLVPQVSDNEGFQFRGAGIMNSNLKYTYTYDYSQNLPWTWHGFEVPVDSKAVYYFSLDAYISPTANLAVSGHTFIADIEQPSKMDKFYYDNSLKGTWQHIEYALQPSANTINVNLYSSTDVIPATTGYIQYQNVELRKAGSITNLYPQAASNSEFTWNGGGVFICEPYAGSIYK